MATTAPATPLYPATLPQQQVIPSSDKNSVRSAAGIVRSSAIRQVLSYGDIASLALRHCSPDPVIPATSKSNPVTFVAHQKAVLLSTPDRLVKSKVFQILENTEQASGSIAPSIIDKNTWKDLDLVCGSDERPSVYLGSVLNRSKTELGKAYLLGLIARPTANIQTLKKRQSLVKRLTGPNHKLTHALRDHLEKMPIGEAQLISFWNEGLELPDCINKQYIRYNDRFDDTFNRSSLALEIHSGLRKIKKITTAATHVASTALLPLYALSLTGALAPSVFLTAYATRFIGTLGPLYAVVSAIPSTYTTAMTAVVAGGFAGFNLEGRIRWFLADLAIDSVLQKKLVAVASYFRNMKAIYELLATRPDLTSDLEHFEKLHAFINNKKLSNLFAALESRTFNSEASYFFRRGNVLLAWNLLQDPKVRKEFESALTAIAEIDAFMSIAQLYNENRGGRVQFCFPEYVEGSRKPSIELNNFWNPFVSREKVVPNSIRLGSSAEAPNAIITAPNAAGKTTVITSIAASIVLAQSICIAPGEMRLTPFTFVALSKERTGDIKAGKSLFQAQTSLMVGMTNTIQNLPEGAFSFTVLDELFTGTTPEEGEALAYATTEMLGRQVKNISMISTHHKFLTELANRTRNFKNYKLSVEDITDRPLYKLEPGVATQHKEFQVAAACGFRSDIIDRAQALVRHKTHE